MNDGRWTKILGKAVLVVCLLGGINLHAVAAGGDGYSIEDLQLPTAGELLDICTIQAGHEHYDTALGFCYGFFEGAVRYHEAIAQSPMHKRIVCDPPSVTREQAVGVFVAYIQANSRYRGEAPIDAIFRALAAKWPCDQ